MKGILELAAAFAQLGALPDQELTRQQIFPNTTYLGAVDPSAEAGARFGQRSDPFYPSPWMTPGVVGWEEAYLKARDFVSQLTLTEKINLTTGVG
jgi:beta-glucosidase